MPVSKRKKDKPRPYRVDYFIYDEMLKDRALVRSLIVRAVTAREAQNKLAQHLGPNAEHVVIRSYRFYKKLTAEPKKKVYKAVDELLSSKKAIEVMTRVENRKFPIVIRPEDLKRESNRASVEQTDEKKFSIFNDAFDPSKFVKLEPEQVEKKEYVTDVTISDDTSNVTAGTPAPIPAPCRWHGDKYLDSTGRCQVPNAAYYEDQRKALTPPTGTTEAVANAIQHAMRTGEEVDLGDGYRAVPITPENEELYFPNRKTQPYNTAVFDDSEVLGEGPYTGAKIDIDKAAPVLTAPAAVEVGEDQPLQYIGDGVPAGEIVQDVVERAYKLGTGTLCAGILTICAIVYLFFKYVAH